MTKSLTVKDEIFIEAPRKNVWEVLIKPKYVAQWDELPEDYPREDMKVGSKVVWKHPNGGETITTIIKADEEQELIISLYSSTWKEEINDGDIAYRYTLEEHNGTLLKIEIGDFSLLKDGQNYYNASVEFATEAKQIIKKLAEELSSFK